MKTQSAKEVSMELRSKEKDTGLLTGASLGAIEALSGAVAGRFNAVLEVEVDHGNDTGDIDTLEVADTSSVVGWGLELRELMLGNFALADRPIIVLVGAGEDVEVRVGIITIVTHAKWASEHAGGDSQDGENGGS